MSINTIKLTEDDVNRRQYLSKLFIESKITPSQARELRQVLENERYMAIEAAKNLFLFLINSFCETTVIKRLSRIYKPTLAP